MPDDQEKQRQASAFYMTEPSPDGRLKEMQRFAQAAGVPGSIGGGAGAMAAKLKVRQEAQWERDRQLQQQQKQQQAQQRMGQLAQMSTVKPVPPEELKREVKDLVGTAIKHFTEGNHTFALESLDLLNKALDVVTNENETLREDRMHLRSENQRLREVNLRLQEQMLKRLEGV